MSLHNEILNIPCEHKVLYLQDATGKKGYKEGHRDARHAAAELALQVDTKLEHLKEILSRCQMWHHGDKWRDDVNAEQRAAWEEHLALINSGIRMIEEMK